jgi:hypothetical protein
MTLIPVGPTEDIILQVTSNYSTLFLTRFPSYVILQFEPPALAVCRHVESICFNAAFTGFSQIYLYPHFESVLSVESICLLSCILRPIIDVSVSCVHSVNFFYCTGLSVSDYLLAACIFSYIFIFQFLQFQSHFIVQLHFDSDYLYDCILNHSDRAFAVVLYFVLLVNGCCYIKLNPALGEQLSLFSLL